MNRYQYSLLLFVAALIVNYVLGTKVRIRERTSSRDYSNDGNEGIKIPNQKSQSREADAILMIENGIHPDHSYHKSETHPSLDTTIEHNFDFLDAVISESADIIDKMIDNIPMQYSPDSSPAKSETWTSNGESKFDSFDEMMSEVSSIIDDLFSSGYIQLEKIFDNGGKSPNHQENSYPVRISSAEPAEFFRDLPVEESFMVDLMPGSGVKINYYVREKFLILKTISVKEFQRKVFEELIYPKELASMSATSHLGFKPVPKNIIKAVEDFVRASVDPKLSHRDFIKNLNAHLNELRRKYKKERIFEGY